MVKSLLLLIACSFAVTIKAQTVVQIDAGSRAPYGYIQSLTIDATGRCRYIQYEVSNNKVKDSATFSITKAQLDTFFAKANAVRFFSLAEEYTRGLDGAGIFIALNNAGKKHAVNVKNSTVPQIDDLVATLNAMLQPRKIRIYYGQQ